ncbi:MAG: hypothetical protein RBT15_02920 [Gudongella sp.]|jgi:lysine-ketoglutarate reductase/saccharopine dehydrogenase-like protein (TIGR00300 family)|nr:hypothetical protein [Gudongella sp.]
MGFRMPKYLPPNFELPGFVNAPDARLVPAPKDTVAPKNFHSTTIFPEYFKVEGEWKLARESRMDCVAVYEGGEVVIKEARRLKEGDLVFVGRTEDAIEGIYVHANAFVEEDEDELDSFVFRQGRTRETAYSMDYKFLAELLKHERENGFVTWVLGPACAFDAESREAFSKLIKGGYADAILAGNALATHDLEASLLGTALGQDISTQKSMPNGHYNHIDAINAVRFHGSIPKFIENENIDSGIMYECVKNDVPFVLTGSIRDDGPLPEVYGDVYEGQDAMRDIIRKSTTVICMATMLHSIATGNMTPTYRELSDGTIRPLYFYSVDISEFAVNKLRDRGSLTVKTIVTNIQDFIMNISKKLEIL